LINKILSTVYPGDIFDKDNLNKSYQDLLKKVHPDLNNNSIESNEATIKLQSLFKQANEDIKNDFWISSNKIIKKKFEFDYIDKFDCDIGKAYYNNQQVYYVFDDNKALFDNTVKKISLMNDLLSRDSRLSIEFSKYLPKTISYDINKTDICLTFPKTPNHSIFSLRSLIKLFNGHLPHEHVSWILSSLYNSCCFLDHYKLVHNGLTIDNLFVDIVNHYVLIFGGWWFTTAKDLKMIGLSKELLNILPLKVRDSKLSNIQTDLEAIRLIARKLFGIDTPKEIKDWVFNRFALDSALKEYNKWVTIVEHVYGKNRSFTKINLK